MDAYDLLSREVRKLIYDLGWKKLRKIQSAAIKHIIQTDHHWVLAAHTASGKTEAAFLPILSTANFTGPGVRVLYISPLIALINDQFERVERLCKEMEVSVTRWHGEAAQKEKNALLAEPSGIVLITPESLEAMFVHNAWRISHLFAHLEYIVIDEIHAFAGNNRGLQLTSLIHRIRREAKSKPRVIGLSATIGKENYGQVKLITGEPERCKVIVDNNKKESTVRFDYYEGKGAELPQELIEALYDRCEGSKTLVFPNSRGRTEEIAVKLTRLAESRKGVTQFFSHHSSIDKEIREHIEAFAKSSDREHFSIACTSTLELGIDIGTVDEVIQVDATHSVASLVQRMGRSGRKEQAKSRLTCIATDDWHLLQSFACWCLAKQGQLEKMQTIAHPFDLCFHQMLSEVKAKGEIKASVLVSLLEQNPVFQQVEKTQIDQSVAQAVKMDHLELLGDEYIIGLEGEKLVNNREFYSVFTTRRDLQVYHKGNRIGEVPESPMILPEQNILLAARVWKITDVNLQGKRVEVVKAKDGKKPLFFGGAGDVSKLVRQEMLTILIEDAEVTEFTEGGAEALEQLQARFGHIPLTDLDSQRPAFVKENEVLCYTFTSSAINRSLHLLFQLCEIDARPNEHSSCIAIPQKEQAAWERIRHVLEQSPDHIDRYLLLKIEEQESILDFSKWARYLPQGQQLSLLKTALFDFEGAKEFLQKTQWVGV